MFRIVFYFVMVFLFILWFGFGEILKILLIVNGVFFLIYVNMYLGICGVDLKLFDVVCVL